MCHLNGVVQARQGSGALGLRLPTAYPLEVLCRRYNDAPEPMRRYERRASGGGGNSSHDVVLEKRHGSAGTAILVSPCLFLRLNLVDPHLLHVLWVLLAHHLSHGVVGLPIIADEDEAKLRIQGEVLFEGLKLFAPEGPHTILCAAADEEQCTGVHRARQKRRHRVEPVLLLQLPEFFEDLLLHHLPDQVRSRTQRNKLAHFAAPLQLTVEGCDAGVRRVPGIALIDASGPPPTGRLQRVVHVGDDFQPGMPAIALIRRASTCASWRGRLQVAAKEVQLLRKTVVPFAQAQELAEVAVGQQRPVRDLRSGLVQKVVKHSIPARRVRDVLEHQLVHRVNVSGAIKSGLEIRQLVAFGAQEQALNRGFGVPATGQSHDHQCVEQLLLRSHAQDGASLDTQQLDQLAARGVLGRVSEIAQHTLHRAFARLRHALEKFVQHARVAAREDVQDPPLGNSSSEAPLLL
mmetsp:Transcript_60271/g.174568  ORF Transcript_60271/g.174568 Transcript_60271/m.174568 type:complete len:462 (-) Transcript_60271:763-2148(-)